MQRFIVSMVLVTCIILSSFGNVCASSLLNPVYPMIPMNPMNPMNSMNSMNPLYWEDAKDIEPLNAGDPLEKDVKVKVIKTENQELWISFEDKIALLEQELRMCVFVRKGMVDYMKWIDSRYCAEKVQQYFKMLRERDKAYKVKKLGEM